ncbi:helix-turn-helix transcriptional regulator [Povalibacter sp.]|uniref:helix-turn-helix transcriptional regulator n=1 Tax=Povalibacter sp. TaxID=1962978 RepID=UPI002F42E34E
MIHNVTRILRLKDVCTQTGLCRSAVYALEARSKFPRRIQLTSRAVGWVEREIVEWVDRRIEASRNAIPPTPATEPTLVEQACEAARETVKRA